MRGNSLRLHNKWLILFMLLISLSIGLMLTGCDGVVEQEKYNVSGEVLDTEGDGVEGVKLNFSGGFGSAETDEDGKWNKSDLKGTVTVTPVKGGLVFEPSSCEVSEEDNQVDFVASIDEGYEIDFVDSNLEQVVRDAISKPSGPIYISDVNELEELFAEGKEIESLEGMQYFQNLRYLNLMEDRHGSNDSDDWTYNYIEDLTPLSGLINLESLLLRNNNIADISVLKNLSNLKTLWVCSNQPNQVENISVVENFVHLEVLCLQSNNISDISAIEDLTKLSQLYLGGNNITQISAIRNLVNLEWLYLWGNQIEDVSPLEDLTSLEYLILRENNIKVIDPLQNLNSLKYISFTFNEVEEIDALKNLTSLNYLYFQNNKVKEIDALQNLTDLIALSFWNNQVVNIEVLENLNDLELLYFGGNQVENISVLENLADLKNLSFWGNKITDINVLEDLTELESLNFRTNEVTDISPLVANLGFGSGDSINMRENYLDLDDDAVMDDIIDLISRGVEVLYIPQREPGETDSLILDYHEYEDIYYIEDRWGIEFGKDYFLDN